MRFRAAIVVAAAVLVAAAPAGAAATGGHAANTSFGADLLAGEATPLAGVAQTEAFAAQGRRPQSGRYGGGGFVPGRFYLTAFSMRLRSGGRGSASFGVGYPCPDLGTDLRYTVSATVRPTRRGTLRGSLPFELTEDADSAPEIANLRSRGTLTVRLRFGRSGLVSGTLRLRETWDDPATGQARGTCDSGAVRVRGGRISRTGNGGPPRPPRRKLLGGLTSARNGVALLTNRRRNIARLGFTYRDGCRNGVASAFTFSGISVGPTGRFAGSGSQTESDAGVRIETDYSVRGRFQASGARGTWRLSSRFVAADGSVLERCTTGRQRWRVRG